MPLPAVFAAIGEGVVLLGPRLAPMAAAVRALFQTGKDGLVTNSINPLGLALAGGVGYAVNEVNQGRADQRLAQELALKERQHQELLAAINGQGSRVDGRLSDVDARLMYLGGQMRDQGHDLSWARAAIDRVQRGVDGVSGKIDRLTHQVGSCPAPVRGAFAPEAAGRTRDAASAPAVGGSVRDSAPLPFTSAPVLEPAL